MRSVNYLRNFGNSTTMHGASKVILTKSTPRRIFWIIFFLASWTIFAVNLFFLFQRYALFERKVSVDIVDEGVPFPWITLCPLNGMNFPLVKRIREIIQVPLNLTDLNGYYRQVLPTLSNSSSDEYVRELLNLYLSLNKIGYNSNSSLTIEQKNLAYSSDALSANIPQATLTKNFFDKDQLVISCRYKQERCNFDLFVQNFNAQFKNCYTYQVMDDNNQFAKNFQVREALKEGVEAGWSTVVLAGRSILDTDDNFNDRQLYTFFIGTVHENIQANIGSVGVRVVIHAPNTTALPSIEGFDVPPGYSTSFAVKPGMKRRLPQPYGKCATSSPYDSDNLKSYRKINCIQECIQAQLMTHCGCFDSHLPTYQFKQTYTSTAFEPQRNQIMTSRNGANNKSNFEFPNAAKNQTDGSEADVIGSECRLYGDILMTGIDFDDRQYKFFERVNCSKLVQHEMLRDPQLRERCNCHPACVEFTYDVSYSLSKWPSSGYEGYFVYKEIVLRYDIRWKLKDSNEGYQMFRDYAYGNTSKVMRDFSRINVYIADNSIVSTKEVPDYTAVDLLSDIGGQLGIWIGVSFLTMTEVFELVFLILRASCCCYGGGKTANSDRNDERDLEKGEGECQQNKVTMV